MIDYSKSQDSEYNSSENRNNTQTSSQYKGILSNATNPSHIKNIEPEKFWLDDPKVLFTNGAYLKIIPTKNMTRIEVLNTLTRFFIYLIIIYLLIGANRRYMYIPIAGIIAILFLYFINKWHEPPKEDTVRSINIEEPFTQLNAEIYEIPTKNNPFMNVTMADLMDNRDRPSAGNVNNPIIQEQIEQAFDANLFTDVEDVFGRGNTQRQFYTTASTTIPNDQTSFAEWVYRGPETCKENQLNCLKYEDVRFSRFNPNIGRMIL